MAFKVTTIGVTVKDNVNQSSTMSFSFDRGFLAGLADFFGWTTAKSDALHDFVQTYSHGVVVRSGISNNLQYVMPNGFIGSEQEKGFDKVDQKAVITLRDANTGAAHTISIPAPRGDMFISSLGDGLRVEPSVGAQIAADFSQVLGRNMVFQEGWLIGKK